jgi:ATP/ADP translocase
MFCGNITNTIPYVSVIITLAIFFWIYAVYGLGKMVNESIDQEIESIDEFKASLEPAIK